MTKRRKTPATKIEREVNAEYAERRARRLFSNSRAVALLDRLGVNADTAKHFRLGLSERYMSRNGAIFEKALLAPVINRTGIFISQSVYLNLPELTVNPAHPLQWMRGAARTYYSGAFRNQSSLAVCASCLDLWSLRQTLGSLEREMDLLLIASTDLSRIPAEWRQSRFWEPFKAVFLIPGGTEESENTAAQIARFSGRKIRRISFPANNVSNWRQYRETDPDREDLKLLFDTAADIEPKIAEDGENNRRSGRFEYRPVDILSSFHRGFLYYPVRTLFNQFERGKSPDGKAQAVLSSRVETIIVRSDRTIHTIGEALAPRGTPPADRILQLSDGTILETRPRASSYATWSWNSIKRFLSGKAQTRPLKTLLGEVKSLLRNSVWLPNAYDYDLLTALVPVTYSQAVFSSVPMIVATGPPATGKSALGRAMASVCANAVIAGQISAAGIARLIDQTRGFVVLDDLESVGTRTGRKDKPQFNELVQSLKLSYNKETSVKLWTDVRGGMRVERLNFFGVKMINNTTGTDPILGSRTLRVRTIKMSPSIESDFGLEESISGKSLSRLRDELHVWAFENARLIDSIYKKSVPRATNRFEEITAPLRVIAELAEDTELSEGLQKALDKQLAASSEPAKPVEIVKRAMEILVQSGFRAVSPTHLALQMKSVTRDSGVETSEDMQVDDPVWVGRQMRRAGCVENNAPMLRKRVRGKSLRVYPISERFISESLGNSQQSRNESLEERAAGDFCTECSNCEYNQLGCPLQKSKP